MSEQLELDLGDKAPADKRAQEVAEEVAEKIAVIANSIIDRTSQSDFKAHILEIVHGTKDKWGLPNERDVLEIAVITMAMAVSDIAEELGLVATAEVVEGDVSGVKHQWEPPKPHTANEGRKRIDANSSLWKGMDTKWKN